MSALLLVLALFAGYWLVGLGTLAAVKADTTQLRVVLVAPALGSALLDLVLFAFNYAGMGVEHCAVPVTVVLLVGAAVALAIRRPTVNVRALAVVGVCLLGLLLVVGPMITYGFRWDSAGNDDMGNYVLSALQILHHGLVVPFDVSGIAHDRDYPTYLQVLHTIGSRPGADIELAGVSQLTGRLPYEVFMPFILSLQLIVACATGALALQSARRWWAAPIAAALVLVSPEASYGWLQQLLGQAAGLGLAAALLALLMDRELHSGERRPRTRDIVPIALLAAAFVLSYVELASTIALAYGAYLLILLVRRRATLVGLLRLLGPVILITVVVLNGYLFRELSYALSQASGGLKSTSGGISFFGFAIVPAALGEISGFEAIPGIGGITGPNLAIALGGILVLTVILGAVRSAWRGSAAAVVVLVDALLAVLLARNASAFGLFKLYMYVQPFIAALLASWTTRVRRRGLLAATAVILIVMVVLQLPVLRGYVHGSRDPIDLVHASDESLMPAFRHFLASSKAPVVAVTDNPTLAKLEAASSGERPIYFVSANIFGSLPSVDKKDLSHGAGANTTRAIAAATWVGRSFNLLDPGSRASDRFTVNPLGSRVLASGTCQIILPTGSELTINRLTLPEGSPLLKRESCTAARDQLAFTNSSLGNGYYAGGSFRSKSLWQAENDLFYPGHTFSGVGRYLLFRVLGPTAGMRLELNFTATLVHNGSNAIPTAAVVGDSRIRLPLVGRGSARVYSQPLRPQMIDGQPYVLIDFGRAGRPLAYPRSGLQGIFGQHVQIDPRFLVGSRRSSFGCV